MCLVKLVQFLIKSKFLFEKKKKNHSSSGERIGEENQRNQLSQSPRVVKISPYMDVSLIKYGGFIEIQNE